MSAELATVDPAVTAALFAGQSDEVLAAATIVANRFSDVITDRKMFTKIGDNKHIHVEAWQTLGSLTGVYAVGDGLGVRAIDWPRIAKLDNEPDQPGPEPSKTREYAEWQAWKEATRKHDEWRLHDLMIRSKALGRAYGFACAFRAVKNGQTIGWGEGRVERDELGWVRDENSKLAAMAQTRGQSRALGAPLRWVVELAGYSPTPAEEMNGDEPSAPAPVPAGPSLRLATDSDLRDASQAAETILGSMVDAHQFVWGPLRKGFEAAGAPGVPLAVVGALKTLAAFKAEREHREPVAYDALTGETITDADVKEAGDA